MSTDKPRILVYISKPLHAEVKRMAKAEQRSMSKMVEILVQLALALKEKKP